MAKMMHKTWCSIKGVPYYFSKSPIKFHTGQKSPIWNRIQGFRTISPGPVFYLCLRMCLETVLAKTVLRHVLDRWRCRFSICLRQTIVLQIQIQVLVNTLAPTKYLFFLKTSMVKQHFVFMNRTQTFLLVICYTSVNILFSNFASRHLRDLDDTRPIVSERAKTTPSHGEGWLSICLRSCC